MRPPAPSIHRNGMTDPDPLARLEERYTFLEQHVAEQDKAFLELANDVKTLRQEITRLRGERETDRDASDSSPEERPPHY